MILITGHAGFIGSHLAGRLSRAGIPWVGLDWSGARGEHALVGDITGLRPADVRHLPITEVIHLAAPVGVATTARQPDTYDRIVAGARAVAALAAEIDVPVMLISTSEVYGECAGPIDESTPRAPLSGYAKGKLEAERIVTEDVPAWTVVHPFNVYGSGQKAEFFVPTLLDRLRRRLPVPLVNRGDPVRQFTYIDDFVEAVERIRVHGYRNRVVCVAGPEAFNLVEATEIAAEVVGASAELRFVAPSALGRPAAAEIHSRRNDRRGLGELLGWLPSTSFRDGIARTLAAEGAGD